jgi:hypothetical protein
MPSDTPPLAHWTNRSVGWAKIYGSSMRRHRHPNDDDDDNNST